MYMLDTNICIYLIKKHPSEVLRKIKDCNPDEVFISSIVEAELRYGADKSLLPAKNHAALDLFLSPITVMAFDEVAGKCFGRVRSELEKKGHVIGPYDLLIGAHCLANGFVLVTNNVREFSRIKGLRIENWTR